MKKSLFILAVVLFASFILTACSGGSGSAPTPPPVVVAPPPPPPPPVKREYLWPLCGHITQAPPAGWQDTDGCPDTRWNEDFADFPLSSSFGPRQKASENFRYDYHRGIDIPTPFGTPLFAVKAGLVTRAGSHPRFVDLGVTLRHYDESIADCDQDACINSLYIHMSDVIVTEGQQVEKGELIGYSGTTAFGIDHLHFEIRQAPGQHDRLSVWQRDAIHPLTVLPLIEDTQEDYTIDFSNVLISNTDDLSLITTITSRNSEALAFKRLELEVYEKLDDGSLLRINQVGDEGVNSFTPEGTPYYVNPSWYDLELVNQQYTYKDSQTFPWTAFTAGGVYESPYADVMPAEYTPNIHLDNAINADTKIGEFNGKIIAPAKFSTNSDSYSLVLEYQNLKGVAEFSKLCLKARAIDAKGKIGQDFSFQCP